MHTEKLDYSSPLRFKLVKGAKPDRHGHDTYRAVMQRGESIDLLTEGDKFLAEFGFDPSILRQALKSLLKQMVKATLADGRTRRFGDMLEVRLDIGGRFDRIDAPFDPEKHELKVNVVPLKGMLKAYARQDNWPKNVRTRPQGKIDYVTYPGGEFGEIKAGEEIVVVGHDLELHYGDYLMLHVVNERGAVERYYVYATPEYAGRILENTPTRLRVSWPAKSPIKVKPGTKPKVYVNVRDQDGTYHPVGSWSEVALLQ